jgi:hypothetical protein
MKKQPFFIELYNLHLSGQIPPTPEEKQKLTEIFCTNRDKYSCRISAYPYLPIVYRKPSLPYLFHDALWWEKKYPDFLNEYTHLVTFLKAYVKRDLVFCKNAQSWLEDVLHIFKWDLSIDFSLEKVNFAIVGICSENSKMTEIQRIFASTYFELINFLQKGLPIKQCQAYETKLRDACQNLFVAEKRQGPAQIFCSVKCRRRIHKHKMTQRENLKKRIVDAKLKK